MIMNRQWMMEYGSKIMVDLVKFLSDEFEEKDPACRDVVAIIRLQDAINFYDTVLCLMQVMNPTFDIELKKVYNRGAEGEEKEKKVEGKVEEKSEK